MSYILGSVPAASLADPTVASLASGPCRTCGHPILLGPSLRGAYVIAWEDDLTDLVGDTEAPVRVLVHHPYHPGCVAIEDEAAGVELLEALAR